MRRIQAFTSFLLTLLLAGSPILHAQEATPPPQAQTKETIVLRVSGLPNAANSDPRTIAELRVLEEFHKKFPHIELQSVEGIRIEGMAAEVGTMMMVAGGISPDVLRLNFRTIDTFASQGVLYPLDEFLDPVLKQDPTAYDERILPQFEDVIVRPGPDGERRTYGMPVQLLVMALYYNRDVFRRAGLPDRAPKDWEEMVEFGKKINELGRPYRPIFLNRGNQSSWNLMNFLWSSGADAVREIAPNEWRATFNGPEAVAAFEFYYQLTEVDRIAVREDGSFLAQNSRNIGMFFGYVGGDLRYDPQLFGIAPVPAGRTGLIGSEINSSLLAIYAGIEDPERRQAAWEYINYVGSEEADRVRTTAMVDMGQSTQVNPVQLRKHGFDELLIMSPPGIEEAFEIAIKNGKPEPYGKNCALVYQELTYPIDQILLDPVIESAWAAGDMETVRTQIGNILDAAVKKTNERMIGFVTPEVKKHRKNIALVVLVVMVIVFVVLGRIVYRTFSQAALVMSGVVGSRSILPWLLLSPALSLIFLWQYIPLVRGGALAFMEFRLMLDSLFVGLDNFATVLFDATFWNSLLATLHFAAYTLSIGFAVPILLAYALHLIPRQKVLFRTIYYLPAVLSATAVYFLWKELFDAQGPLNTALNFFGIETRRAWSADPKLAMLSCVIPGIWAAAGPQCLIYLAALKTIPEEQFEAAEIDGAGIFHKTRHIVFPGLKALIIINFVGAVVTAFQAATNILIMTGGGPNGATEVTSLLIFYEAFMRIKFGTATAMAWLLGSMVIGLTVIQLRRLSRMEFRTAK